MSEQLRESAGMSDVTGGPGRDVFEYALVRVVPRVDRGEQINAGVIVYSKSCRYLKAKIILDEPRLLALAPDADVDAVKAALKAFEAACSKGPLAERPLGERFRWLTAPRSAIVQPGPVHSGVTDNPEADLNRLFGVLVALPGRTELSLRAAARRPGT